MPFDINGNYTLPSPQYPLVANTLAKSSDVNTLLQDIANALGQAILRNGSASFSGPVGGQPPVTSSHFVTLGYLQGLYTAADVLAKILTVDGSGSGLDADLLDGQDGGFYSNIAARLGYTPANKAGDVFSGSVGFAIGAGNDPYGAVSVTRPNDANQYSYYGMTKSGIIGCGIGIGNLSDIVFGQGSNNAGNSFTNIWMRFSNTTITIPAATTDVIGLNLGAGTGTIAARALKSGSGNNLHLDAAAGASTYLNFFTGNSIIFGNGASGAVGSIDNAGNAVFNGTISASNYNAAGIIAKLGYTPLNQASYTAADVVSKLSGQALNAASLTLSGNISAANLPATIPANYASCTHTSVANGSTFNNTGLLIPWPSNDTLLGITKPAANTFTVPNAGVYQLNWRFCFNPASADAAGLATNAVILINDVPSPIGNLIYEKLVGAGNTSVAEITGSYILSLPANATIKTQISGPSANNYQLRQGTLFSIRQIAN